MARTKDPGRVVTTYQDAISEWVSYYTEVYGYLDTAGVGLDRLKTLAESVFFAIGVETENLMTDYVIACINRRPATYNDYLRRRVTEIVDEADLPVAGADVHAHLRSAYSLDDVTEKITPNGLNIKFRDHNDLRAKAVRWLHQDYRDALATWGYDDTWLLDAVKIGRNYLAHRADTNLDDWNAHLRRTDPGGVNCDIGRSLHSRKVNDVGAYLNTTRTGGRRLNVFVHRLHNVAEMMRP